MTRKPIIYRYTYDKVTEESAAEGDTYENGFWMPGGWEHPIDGYDVDPDVGERNLEDARKGEFDIIAESGWLDRIMDTLGPLEVQRSGTEVTGYEVDPMIDDFDGTVTRRTVHIKARSAKQAKAIARILEGKPPKRSRGGYGYAYELVLAPEDVRTIDFVGGRYAWSSALQGLGPGRHRFAEHEAWELREAFEEDTEGGHSFFPMLDPRSDLAEKLYTFMDEIV